MSNPLRALSALPAANRPKATAAPKAPNATAAPKAPRATAAPKAAAATKAAATAAALVALTAAAPAAHAAPATQQQGTLAAPPAPPALVAAAPAGQRFDGRAPRDVRNHVSTTSDGTQLKTYDIFVAVRCSDGRVRNLGHNDIEEDPVAIADDGSFGFATAPAAFDDGDLDGQFSDSLTGRFDPSGDSVAITYAVKVEGGRVSCDSGPVSYTLYRNGTPQAPLSNSRMTTGRYRASGKRLRSSVAAHVPEGSADFHNLRFSAPCRNGLTYSGSSPTFVWVNGAGRFSWRETYSIDLRGNSGTARVSYKISGRLLRSRGRYRVAGTWIATVKLDTKRDGRTTCRLRTKFAGTGR